ncbi:MAG: hypothetical protein GY837_07220, partial [Bosea sp.]|nr:hypothetical protein [Bosea sp. (in: a-proteobacteria)]
AIGQTGLADDFFSIPFSHEVSSAADETSAVSKKANEKKDKADFFMTIAP